MSSSSDKRRGGGSGGSSSHVLRTTSTSSASSSSNRNSIIAPPPRAALGSSNATSADEGASHTSNGGGGPSGPGGGGGGSGGGSSKDTVSTSSAASAAVAAAAASMQLVKEKDLRIAQLERELVVMESEFTRELDKLSQNESETASFWQAKHSALNQQFLRADTELRLLRAEVELRAAERDELRAGWDGMKRDLAARDDEVRDLRGQVRGLKEWVSTSTRSDDQTSDEVFGEGMARLGSGLQNWVISNFRRSRLDVSKASKATKEELARLVPTYEQLMHSAKVHLLQSVISRLLVELVFGAYFIGLSPEQARQFAQMESLLSSFAGTAEPVNQWRSQTLSIVRKDAAQRLQTETSRITEDVVTSINSILDSITENKSTEARNQALRALIVSAIDLARMLVVQKAVFKVSMPEVLPHQRVMFDPSIMEDIGGEDEDGITEREICCVTFPGIIKKGDETGGQLQFTNVISKSKVLCSPE